MATNSLMSGQDAFLRTTMRVYTFSGLFFATIAPDNDIVAVERLLLLTPMFAVIEFAIERNAPFSLCVASSVYDEKNL